jgi:DNA-binding transcriptional MerR regulator
MPVTFAGLILLSADVAKAVGVSADAVRLARRRGYITPTAFTVGGEALYDESAVEDYRSLRSSHRPGRAFEFSRLRLVR